MLPISHLLLVYFRLHKIKLETWFFECLQHFEKPTKIQNICLLVMESLIFFNEKHEKSPFLCKMVTEENSYIHI